ncbi:MAG TPA: OsmC family protein [Balneolaceae bacterium]|nr:OsmC family protein [Balneolaceae bacterium]
MSYSQKLKRTFERNRKALSLKPSFGQYTTVTKISLRDGTTCEVEHGDWKFICDVGTDQGGNDAGPGPSVLQRAALGSCLAIGYSTWAAVLDIPIHSLKVEVEAEVDARGQFDLEDRPPGYKSLSYRVSIDSPASREEILRMLDKADACSPVLDDFTRPLEVNRKVQITASSQPMKEES